MKTLGNILDNKKIYFWNDKIYKISFKDFNIGQ